MSRVYLQSFMQIWPMAFIATAARITIAIAIPAPFM
jgi:hypothetical protein